MTAGPATREQVVAEAMTWLGTPFQHQASLRGVGCDCLGLLRGVWRGVIGAEPEALPAYTPDWAESGRGEALLAATERWLVPRGAGNAEGGDVVLFRWAARYPAKHAAILIAPDRFIHAQQGAVVAIAALVPWWRRRIAGVFSFPDLE